MKPFRFFLAALFAPFAYATAPVTDSISVRESNITPGQTITVDATAHDDDGNLQTFHFFQWNPGWSEFATPDASNGSQCTATVNWTVPGSPGHYYIHFRANDSDGTWDSNANQMAEFDAKWGQSVSSNDVQINYGDSFTPPFSGGGGSGVWQWCVGGYTAWGGSASGTLIPPDYHAADSWTPPSAGTYQFWVMKLGDGDYWTSNISGPYTLTVNRASMSDPTSQNDTISVGQSWSPGISTPGGNGSGAAVFCVPNQTPFISGSWTPTSPGTYTFYVGQIADANHQGNITDPGVGLMQLNYTAYTVQVNAPPISFNFSGGPFTYDGSSHSVSVSPSPNTSNYSTSGDYSAVNAGTYTAYANATNGYTGSGSYTWTINPANQSSVGISPSNPTVTVGTTLTFSASGGSGNGGWVWGGDTGSSATVTFNLTGTHYVTVYHQGDGNYYDSNTATATITVNAPVTYALTVVNGTGSASGLTQGTQVTITANAPPSGQMFNGWTVSGPGSIGNAGAASTTFTMGAGSATVTATYRTIPPTTQDDTANQNQLDIELPTGR